MKKILIVASLILPLGLTQAEEIKVYPQGVSQEKSSARTHNWSTTDKEKRKKSIKGDVRCNGDIKKITKHKRRPSKKGIYSERTKF